MDLETEDQRAWALAPLLVVVGDAGGWLEWVNPRTGTTCQLDTAGDYVVLRRRRGRVLPVVAGQITSEQAETLFADPEAIRSRRAAAHAIVAVDAGLPD